MAFGDTYGYKTNSRFVAAVAETDEYTDDAVEVADGVEVTDFVDVVLHGFANGRRKHVPVVTVAETTGDFEPGDPLPNNVVVAAADVDQDGPLDSSDKTAVGFN